MRINDSVVKVYDDVLSKFKHVSTLSFDKDNYIKMIKMLENNNLVLDKDIMRAHQCFIGDVITTATSGKFSEALQAIKYPSFNVLTYVPNLCYYHRDNFSMEKSVIMLKKYVLNLVINDEKSKLDSSDEVLNVLQIEKIDIDGIYSFYTLKRYAIGLNMFYNLYNRVVLKNRGYGMPTKDEIVYLDNIAIDQGLLVMDPLEVIQDGEFIIKEEDYPMLKKYIKDKYKIDFKDKFIMPKGEENNVWLYKEIERFDNRPLVNVGDKKEIVPLSYQKSLRK